MKFKKKKKKNSNYIKHCLYSKNSNYIKHYLYSKNSNRLGDEMVSVLASSAVDRGFEPRLGQTKDNKIGICCFSAEHTALRRQNKDWLARNQDNVSEGANMSIRKLLFQ